MITYKEWFIFLVNALLLLADSAHAITFELDKPTIQIGETATLKIKIPHAKDESSPQVFEELLTENKNIKLLEKHTSRNEDAFEITYELTAHKSGNYQIPPIQVQWGANTYSTSALGLSVFTSRGEGDSEIRPEFQRIAAPFSWKKFLLGLYWIMGFSIGAWVLFWIIKKIPWRNLRTFTWQFSLPKLESDKKWLKLQVAHFRRQLQSEGASPKMVDDITYCLKVYLKKRTKVPATALTTDELRNRFSRTYHTNDIFHKSDSFKFEPIKNEPSQSIAEYLLKKIEEEFL